MKIELRPEEAEALVRLLDWTLPELSSEVFKAESEPLRKRIQEQERLLLELKERIDEELAKNEVMGVS